MKKNTVKSVFLNTPYAVWSLIFIIVPLLFVFYYSFWDADAHKITFDYINTVCFYREIF